MIGTTNEWAKINRNPNFCPASSVSEDNCLLFLLDEKKKIFFGEKNDTVWAARSCAFLTILKSVSVFEIFQPFSYFHINFFIVNEHLIGVTVNGGACAIVKCYKQASSKQIIIFCAFFSPVIVCPRAYTYMQIGCCFFFCIELNTTNSINRKSFCSPLNFFFLLFFLLLQLLASNGRTCAKVFVFVHWSKKENETSKKGINRTIVMQCNACNEHHFHANRMSFRRLAISDTEN